MQTQTGVPDDIQAAAPQCFGSYSDQTANFTKTFVLSSASILPLFHRSSSRANSGPVPRLEPVLPFWTNKEPALVRKKWFH